jgi:hypothetical protein
MSRRARAAACAAALALAVLATPAATAADPALERKVDELVSDLGEPDANVRARAAKAVRALGREVVPLLMARLPAEVGTRKWEGVLDAAGDLDADAAIAEIQSTRSEWRKNGWLRPASAAPPRKEARDEKPPPRRGRRGPQAEPEAPRGERVADAILDRLRSRRPAESRRSVALEPGELWDAAAVPPWVERPVGRKLPDEIAGADVPAREAETKLELDLARDGKFSTAVPADFARVVETGTKRAPRKVVVFRRLGRWLAAPAATLSGEADGVTVEFLDTDFDGAFDGDDDLVRFGGGAFRLVSHEPAFWTPKGLRLWRLRRDGARHTLEIEDEPEPAWRTPEQAKEMDELNRWRQAAGLVPDRIDRARSDACRLHHVYWERNGFSGHDQYKDRPAFDARGAVAGKRSSVGTSPDGARFVRDIMWTILHRNSCVGDGSDGVGAWAGPAGSLLWGSEIDLSERAAPMLVPGPGQSDVPVRCEPEIPVPDRDPRYYATPRGTPVAVTWGRLGGRWAELTGLSVELFAEGRGDPLPGTLWSKEHRYKEDFASGFPEESAIFCADAPLAPDTPYVARFRATGKEGPVEMVWQFRTGDDAAPSPGDPGR